MKLIAIDNVNIGDVYLSATMSLNRSCNGIQTIIVRLQSIHAKPKIIANISQYNSTILFNSFNNSNYFVCHSLGCFNKIFTSK